MKRNFFLILIVMLLQSCFAHITQDYGGLSRALVFNDGKKYLINDIYTDLGSTQRERLNKKVLETFQKLSGGNAVSYSVAKSAHLVPGRIAIKPDAEDLLELKDNSDFGYLVNIYTKKVRSDLAPVETGDIYQFSKNEAFAVLEVYDLSTQKKIYTQKASAEMAQDKTTSDDFFSNNGKRESKGPKFYYSAETLSEKSLKKILSDIDKNAIR